MRGAYKVITSLPSVVRQASLPLVVRQASKSKPPEEALARRCQPPSHCRETSLGASTKVK